MRLKSILRNNLILVPNLLRGNANTFIYVLQSWLNNNLILLFPPLARVFQLATLKRRIRSLNPIIVNFHPIYKYNVLNQLDICYINLAHRQDRNIEIINEFNKLGLENYSRFNAIKNTSGALGCAMSHMTILENWTANSPKLLMVCEDDIKFNDKLEELELILSEFINDNNLDILCLSYNHFNEASYNGIFNLTSDTQTMSCYVVKPHMKEILLDNFKLSVKLLETRIDNQYKVAIDQVWKVLQKKYNFVIPKKRFAFQRESYSDIENRVVDYKV